jgi:hypothetical protein
MLLGKDSSKETLWSGIIEEPGKTGKYSILELFAYKGWPGLWRFSFEPIASSCEGV